MVGGVTQRDSGDEQVRPKAEAELVGDRRRRTSRRASSAGAERPAIGARVGSAADRRRIGQQDAGLLEQLADRGHVGRERRRRRKVAAQRARRPRPA